MQDGTNAGQKPHTAPEASSTEKSADQSTHYLRCPSCGYNEFGVGRDSLASRQRRTPCPNCDRMMALSSGGDR